jgi:hypothetical protein
MKRALGLLLLLPSLVACGGIELYDVVRTPVADCEIRPTGEFCGDVGAAVNQVFAVERKEATTVLYFDEQTWVADGITGERSVLKETQVTRDPGPCTSLRRAELAFDEDGANFTGTLEISTRIEGPDACGETPRGERRLFSLTGQQTNSI